MTSRSVDLGAETVEAPSAATAGSPATRPSWSRCGAPARRTRAVATRSSRPPRCWSERLTAAGLAPRVLPSGTGRDLRHRRPASRVVALRADIDALPLTDTKHGAVRVDRARASATPAVTTCTPRSLLGAGLALAGAAGPAAGRVRLIFQPAEESVPGGALDAIDGGVLKDVERIFALHCDPRLATGRVGLRTGPITAACDQVDGAADRPGRAHRPPAPHRRPGVRAGPGDHRGAGAAVPPGRPAARHVAGLGRGRRRRGAPNTIPQDGELRGTVRMLSRDAWDGAEDLVRGLVAEVVAPTGAVADVQYAQGVPPVVNDASLDRAAAGRRPSPRSARTRADDTEQSLGGEDFAWYLDQVPGALARLGVRGPAARAPRWTCTSRPSTSTRTPSRWGCGCSCTPSSPCSADRLRQPGRLSPAWAVSRRYLTYGWA